MCGAWLAEVLQKMGSCCPPLRSSSWTLELDIHLNAKPHLEEASREGGLVL